MVDQTKVTSGFDVEFLMTEEFIRFFLLCSLDTGSIPWATESSGASGTPPTPYRTVTIIHPPVALQDARLYPVFPEFEGHEHPHLDLAPAYSTRPDELQVTILDSDPRGADISVRVSPTVVDTLVVPPSVRVAGILPIDLALRFEIVSTARADGLLGDIELELELVDVSGPLIDAIEQLLSDPDPPPLPTRADILAQLKDTIDRSVPFAVSGGGALQRIETRTFAGDPGRPSAIGVYIDLALRNGPAPSEFLTTVRGDTSLAQNYLEPGMTMAFAFPAETYGLLSDDLKFKMARPREDDPTEFHYPLMDGDDQIGVLHGITVRPETVPMSSPPVFTNALVIDIHGEYEVDNWFDPDFHLRLTLRPETGPRGVFDFDVDVDLSLSATATLSALFVGLVTSVFLPQLGIPLTFLTVIAIKAVEHYGAEAAGSAIESEGGMTSFLDTLPHKLVVEQRRWDPLYATDHRVETGDVDAARQRRRLRDGRERAVRRTADMAAHEHGDPQRDPCSRRGDGRSRLSRVGHRALPVDRHPGRRRGGRPDAVRRSLTRRGRHRVASSPAHARAGARPHRGRRPSRGRPGLRAGEGGRDRPPGLPDSLGVADRDRRGTGHRARTAARRVPEPARRNAPPPGDRRATGRARPRRRRRTRFARASTRSSPTPPSPAFPGGREWS